MNTAFTTQIWYRPNLGKGRFGPLELVETEGIVDATGNAKLGLRLALDMIPLPPASPGLKESHTLALTNAYPKEGPSPVDGAGSITMVKFPYRNLDADGDGVANLFDNAVSKPNPDQADGDGDGIGDVIDDLPCGPDADGDGVVDSITSPASACAGLQVDNCPGRANSKQTNGNIRAEVANAAKVLGDACDPVPHAVPVPLWGVQGVNGSPTTTTCGTPAGPLGSVICLPRGFGYRALVGMGIKAVGQHAAPDLADVPEGAVNVPRTNARFCVESTNGSPSLCGAPAFKSAALIDQSAPIRKNEVLPPSAAGPWRRVSIDGLSEVALQGTLPYDGTFEGPAENGQLYRTTVLFPQRTWNWAGDLAAWQKAFGPGFPFGGTEDVVGTFAMQAETPGALVPTEATFGFHPLANDPTKAAENLAVGAANIAGVSMPYFRLFPKASEWRVRPVTSLVFWLPLSRGDCSPATPSDLCRTTTPQSAVPLFRHPVPAFVGIVDEDGAIREVGDGLSAALRTRLSSSALVLSASEPSDDLGGHIGSPRMVVLTPGAERLEGQLRMADGILDFEDGRRGTTTCASAVGAPWRVPPRPLPCRLRTRPSTVQSRPCTRRRSRRCFVSAEGRRPSLRHRSWARASGRQPRFVRARWAAWWRRPTMCSITACG